MLIAGLRIGGARRAARLLGNTLFARAPVAHPATALLAGAPAAFLATALLAACVGLTTMAQANAQSPFMALSGNWSGQGKVRFTGGSSEAVTCKAYYSPKEAGTSLGVAILCASPSSKIELRAQLKYEGGKVTGKWEERTYNAAGAVEGQASSNKISVSIVGGGLTGTMAVDVNGASQSVQIRTEGIGMTGVDISLSRG